jgi:class 3 adenylate cyclase
LSRAKSAAISSHPLRSAVLDRQHSLLNFLRYLKVSLFIGFVVSLVVAGLHEAGVWARLDAALAVVFGQQSAPPASRTIQYPLFILAATGIAWTTIDVAGIVLKFVIAVAVLVQVVVACVLLHLFGIFFSPWACLCATTLSFFIALIYSQSPGGSRKRIVHEMFGDRVSEKTFIELIDSDQPLIFDGEMCEASVVVCEIFNHEELSEALPVTDYVAMNNAFLRNASEFLVSRGGYLDECDGESLRVIFGTPLPDIDHARTAAAAAVALTARLDEVNDECHKVWKQMFDFRVGVNSGEMVVAAYGSRRLGNFSVAGEPVEFARRLCAANTIYGSRILIGCGTFSLAECDIEVRPMELIQRYQDERSREEVYELLALRGMLPFEEIERRDLFWKGIVYYRQQQWDEALSYFYSARLSHAGDGPVEFYIRRIEQLRKGLASLDWSSARF